MKIIQHLKEKKELFLILISVIFCLGVIDDNHNWGGDFALYIEQARALVEGTTKALWEENRWAMTPIPDYGPDLAPIGFPLLLAPVYAVFGLNFIAFKVYLALFFILACFFSYQLFVEHLCILFSLNTLFQSVLLCFRRKLSWAAFF